MKQKVLVLIILLLSPFTLQLSPSIWAAEKSELQQQAEDERAKGNVASARYHYIRAFEDYANKGLTAQSVECGVKATALYYNENYYQEAFELLRRIDQVINADKNQTAATGAALHYQTTKERMQMYVKMRRSASAKDQLTIMENHAAASNDESVKNDLLYNKAIFYYTFGQNAQGNEVFNEMAAKLTASGDYDKVDQVYKTLIDNGRKSGNAGLVAQSYSNYIVWKDSVTALQTADTISVLHQQIADNEAHIADQDSTLTSRNILISTLVVITIILAAALIIGAVILMRFIVLTRKQKKTIRTANENNALQAKFISNISDALQPTLGKLDSSLPEVKAMVDFSKHIQTLSELQEKPNEEVELEDTQIQAFCESIIQQVESPMPITLNAPKISAKIYKPYVSHILIHLLNNAVQYTPEGGKITLDFKKRGAHTHQFIVSDTGCGIPEEKREEIFKPFLHIQDLTAGDGLGLPICKQMAMKMNGDLDIDPAYTKGTRFVLDLHQ